MTPNETKILKFIWENNGVASVFKIAKAERLGTDYLRLICGKLTKDKLIVLSNGQYKILDLGKTQLEASGAIKKTHPVSPESPTPQKVLARNIEQKKIIRAVKKKKTVTKKRKKAKDLNIKKMEGTALAQLSISPKLKRALIEKGFKTLESIALTAVSRLMETIKGLELEEAAGIINEARLNLKKEGKEYLWE